jgi:hypothetical protein
MSCTSAFSGRFHTGLPSAPTKATCPRSAPNTWYPPASAALDHAERTTAPNDVAKQSLRFMSLTPQWCCLVFRSQDMETEKVGMTGQNLVNIGRLVKMCLLY